MKSSSPSSDLQRQQHNHSHYDPINAKVAQGVPRFFSSFSGWQPLHRPPLNFPTPARKHWDLNSVASSQYVQFSQCNVLTSSWLTECHEFSPYNLIWRYKAKSKASLIKGNSSLARVHSGENKKSLLLHRTGLFFPFLLIAFWMLVKGVWCRSQHCGFYLGNQFWTCFNRNCFKADLKTVKIPTGLFLDKIQNRTVGMYHF